MLLKRTPVDWLIQSGQTERRWSPFPRCLESMRVSERGTGTQQRCLMGGMCGGWEEGGIQLGVRAMEEYGSGFKFVWTLRIRGPGPSVCEILFAGSNEILSLWSWRFSMSVTLQTIWEDYEEKNGAQKDWNCFSRNLYVIISFRNLYTVIKRLWFSIWYTSDFFLSSLNLSWTYHSTTVIWKISDKRGRG